MKPFNLKEALEGKSVITRDGAKVLELVHLKKLSQSNYCIAAVVEGKDSMCLYTGTGKYLKAKHDSEHDLFMATPKKYTNVFLNATRAPFCHGEYNSYAEAIDKGVLHAAEFNQVHVQVVEYLV